MKLIILYGPPGVGKLTVARALAKKKQYKVFHNHLLIELLCSLFEWGSAPYNKFVQAYRIELLEAAAKHRVCGVIVTLVYGPEAGIKEVRQLLTKMNRLHVDVCFVKLECSQRELQKRLRHPSRKAFTKLRRVADLRRLQRKYNLKSSITVGKNLTIDTTSLSAAGTAQRIIDSFFFVKMQFSRYDSKCGCFFV